MSEQYAFTLTVIPAKATEEFISASLMVMSRGLPAASLDSCFDDLESTDAFKDDKEVLIDQWKRYLVKIKSNRTNLGYLNNNTVCFPESDPVFSQVLEQFYSRMGGLVALESA